MKQQPKREKEKLERQNSEVVKFELALPEKETKHSQNILAAIACATSSALRMICYFMFINFFYNSFRWHLMHGL